MHSPSRVQIPPSPLPAPGFPWNPGASSLPVLLARVLGAGWMCFLRCPPCGWARKAPGYRAQRVGFVVIFRLIGAGKSVLKVVVFAAFLDSPKSQTTSPKTAHFCHFLARWSALWACVAAPWSVTDHPRATTTWAPTCPAYQPAVSHVGRLLRTLTRCSVRGRCCPGSE